MTVDNRVKEGGRAAALELLKKVPMIGSPLAAFIEIYSREEEVFSDQEIEQLASLLQKHDAFILAVVGINALDFLLQRSMGGT